MANQSIELEFSKLAGDLAESLSLNKSIGQIYGFLFLSSEPVSLDEISNKLAMSKGNASINLRTLESWGAVRSVSVHGSRRDHYQAHRDLKQLLLRRIQEGVTKRLDIAEESFHQLAPYLQDKKSSVHVQNQLKQLEDLISNLRSALSLAPKLLLFLSK